MVVLCVQEVVTHFYIGSYRLLYKIGHYSLDIKYVEHRCIFLHLICEIRLIYQSSKVCDALGQYSTGKTSMIKYLIGSDYPDMRVGRPEGYQIGRFYHFADFPLPQFLLIISIKKIIHNAT